MATYAKVGAFNTGTEASGSVVVSGVGFEPKVIIFWWSGRTESTNTVGRQTHQRGFGFVTGTTSRAFVTTVSADAAATSDSRKTHRTDGCIGRISTDATEQGRLDLQSFDSDGFTLVIDVQFTASQRISYLALGGDSITNAGIDTFQTPGSSGLESYTGLGFQPSMLIFISAITSVAAPSNSDTSRYTLGWTSGTGSSENGVIGGGASDGDSTMNTAHYEQSGECFVRILSALDSMNGRAILDSFDVNGFTLNWLESATDQYVHVLGIAGVDAQVGSILTRTDTADISESGLGFRPAAVLFGSCCTAENTVDTIADDDIWSVGAGDGSTQSCQAIRDEDNVANSEVTTVLNNDNVYINPTTAAISGSMELRSIGSDGFTTGMTDTDPSAAFVTYLAIGPGDPPGGSGGFVTWIQDD